MKNLAFVIIGLMILCNAYFISKDVYKYYINNKDKELQGITYLNNKIDSIQQVKKELVLKNDSLIKLSILLNKKIINYQKIFNKLKGNEHKEDSIIINLSDDKLLQQFAVFDSIGKKNK